MGSISDGFTPTREILCYLAKVFSCSAEEIAEVTPLTAGMTNHSFSFRIKGEKYICRVPGEGSGQLVNRRGEKEAYRVIGEADYTEELIDFRDDGLKISKYLEGVSADADNPGDVKKCMAAIRHLHEQKFRVSTAFDLWEKILYYEKLCLDCEIKFDEAYEQHKQEMKLLYDMVMAMKPEFVFCHIDCIPDNCLIRPDGKLMLIDWEYAAMNDRLLDVAMFAIYSYYGKEKADELLNIYLEREACTDEKRRYYAYMAMGGFLWKLWTDYKYISGVDFGDYGEKMAEYAKEYYQYTGFEGI